MSQREIALLESDLNCCKREREVMEQQYHQRRERIRDRMRSASNQPNSTEITRNLMMEMMALDREYRMADEKMSNKVLEARLALIRKLQS